MPQPTFLDSYLTFAANNEAPRQWHRWAGLMALSACVGRKVWLTNGPYKFYPNIYTVLVGDAGLGKNAALDPCKALLRLTKIVPITADVMTSQAWLRWMSGADLKEGVKSPCFKTFKNPSTGAIEEYTHSAIIVGELISFISNDPEGWIVLLTNIFSEEMHEVKTKHAGDDMIMGPYITVFGALTTEVSQQLHNTNIIATGFGRRCNFVYAAKREAPMALMEMPDQSAKDFCVGWLKSLEAIKGEFDWRPAKKWYKDWYDGPLQKEKKESNPHTKSYFESKNMQLIKLAMLMALGESSDLILHPYHFEAACELLKQNELWLPRVFGGSGRNVNAPVVVGLMDRLEREHEAVPYKRLFAEFMSEIVGGLRGYDELIEALKAIGKIVRWTETIPPCPSMPNGGVVDYVGTPTAQTKFKAKVNKLLPPAPVLPPALKKDVQATIDLSPVPLPGHGQKSAPDIQASASPVHATEAVELPKQNHSGQKLEIDLS